VLFFFARPCPWRVQVSRINSETGKSLVSLEVPSQLDRADNGEKRRWQYFAYVGPCADWAPGLWGGCAHGLASCWPTATHWSGFCPPPPPSVPHPAPR
jgi:hypothetical protein